MSLKPDHRFIGVEGTDLYALKAVLMLDDSGFNFVYRDRIVTFYPEGSEYPMRNAFVLNALKGMLRQQCRKRDIAASEFEDVRVLVEKLDARSSEILDQPSSSGREC